MKKIILLVYLIIAGNLFSQWSSNPGLNTTVCDLDNRQTFPKIVTTSDGGCYITWFDTRGNGQVKIYLQRLNGNGVKQFASDGLLISDHPQNSWFGDYDLKVDQSNNAIIVFSDKRGVIITDTTVNPYAYKISPTGQFLWGPNGVTLSNETNTYQMWPKCAVLTDGSVAFVWWYVYPQTRTTWIKMQRVSSAGVNQFAAPIDIQSPDGKRYQYPDVIASDNGNYIVSWVYGPKDTVGSFVPDNITLFCNKYNSSGATAWNTFPKTVFTGTGNRIPIYMVPKIISDQNNGIVLGYFHTTTNLIYSSVQRYNAAGIQAYTDNGVLLSTNSFRDHVDPAISYNPASEETYGFFIDANAGTQSHQAIYGQRISTSGIRMWSDSGFAFSVPAPNVSIFGIGCNIKDTNIVVTYATELDKLPLRDFFHGFRVGPAGQSIWGTVILSNVVSLKGYINTCMNSSGMTMAAWEDSRNTSSGGGGGLYAQNLKLDGTLGPVGIYVISSNIPERFRLNQNYPNPFNPLTNLEFEIWKLGFVSLKVYDMIGEEVATLVNTNLNPGTYKYVFDASGLTSGIYFYTLKTDNFSETKKMILVK